MEKNRLVRDALSEGGVCDLAALESYSVFLNRGGEYDSTFLKDSRYMAVIGWGGFSLAIHAVKECNPSLICDASVFIKGTVGRVSSLVFKKKKVIKNCSLCADKPQQLLASFVSPPTSSLAKGNC